MSKFIVSQSCVYTSEHEWLKNSEQNFLVGITDYAQSELGDVVFVDLPTVGDSFKQGDVMANVESVKAVSEIYAPIDGVIVGVNEDLKSSPQLVNEQPFDFGWMVIMSSTDALQVNGLLKPEQYEELINKV